MVRGAKPDVGGPKVWKMGPSSPGPDQMLYLSGAKEGSEGHTGARWRQSWLPMSPGRQDRRLSLTEVFVPSTPTKSAGIAGRGLLG